jgi:phage tail sheath protein FI
LPRGVTIQGVRSLAWPDREPWRFLSTRRLFNFLRRALRPIGLSYVFEPNSIETWVSLRRDLEGLLRDMYRRGAFAGPRPEDAFFVKVDESLNPEPARENGVLTVEIGVAPAVPLEFLVVRLIVGRGIVDVTEEPIVQ